MIKFGTIVAGLKTIKNEKFLKNILFFKNNIVYLQTNL